MKWFEYNDGTLSARIELSLQSSTDGLEKYKGYLILKDKATKKSGRAFLTHSAVTWLQELNTLGLEIICSHMGKSISQLKPRLCKVDFEKLDPLLE